MLFARSQSFSADHGSRCSAGLPFLDLGFDRVPEQLLRLVQPAELLVGDVCGRELGGQPFELGADEVRLAYFVRRVPRTIAPRFGSSTTTPVDCSLRSASRTGCG